MTLADEALYHSTIYPNSRDLGTSEGWPLARLRTQVAVGPLALGHHNPSVQPCLPLADDLLLPLHQDELSVRCLRAASEHPGVLPAARVPGQCLQRRLRTQHRQQVEWIVFSYISYIVHFTMHTVHCTMYTKACWEWPSKGFQKPTSIFAAILYIA